MNAQQLLNEILPILYSIKEDKEKLQKVLDFLNDEIFEEPEENIVIPEKFRELVHSVAENIDCRLVCFINPETLEVEETPKAMFDDPYEYNLQTGMDSETENFLHEEWESCIIIEPRESHESFGIMEKFIDEVNDKILKNKLINALNNRRPFANFKNIVESSNYRKEWFAFKQRQLEMMVWEELEYELENLKNNK